MHVVVSFLLYWLLSYRVDFLVGAFMKDVSASTFFFVLLLFQDDIAYLIFIATLKKNATTLSCPYSVEIHSLSLT